MSLLRTGTTRAFTSFASSATVPAVCVHKHGGPEVLQLNSVPTPALVDDTQVLVAVEKAGLNFIDTYFRSGLYGSAEDLPIILGKEAAGVIVAAGARSGAVVGDRVACLVGAGAYAGAAGNSSGTAPPLCCFDASYPACWDAVARRRRRRSVPSY